MSAHASKQPRRRPVLVTASALVTGLLIVVAGTVPWVLLAPLNARHLPDIPWAALAMLAYLVLLIAWLNGAGWPRATKDWRRYHLRLWRPPPGAWRISNLIAVLALMAGTAALYPLWIAFANANAQGVPDMSAYPTTAFRISVVVMGALVSGIVEEVAYRGYMQSQLEQVWSGAAIPIMAVVFVLSHATNGLAMLPLAPGLFVAAVLYGLLASRTGSIVPGMIIHAVGDAAFTYFGLLRGDASLLFAP
jgi:uncharacterized protein